MKALNFDSWRLLVLQQYSIKAWKNGLSAVNFYEWVSEQ